MSTDAAPPASALPPRPSTPPAGWTPERSAAGLRNPWMIVVILSLATFMEVLDSSVANIALAPIGGSLAATYDETTWILTSYLVANAVIVPLSGWLSAALGRKRYYMISVALFTVTSIACAFAPSIGWLIVFRVLQGLGGGGLAPCEQSMLIDTFAPKDRGKAISAYGLVLILAPALGPSVGGFITDVASWRWIFLINVPVGLVSLLLVGWLVQEADVLKRERLMQRAGGWNVDVWGFALVAVGLGALQFVIDRGQQSDWFASRLIVTMAVAAAAALGALVWWELRRENPVLDLRLFRDRPFACSCALMFVTGAVLYATTQVVPQFLEQILGYTPGWAGLAMTASSAATVLATVFAGTLANRIPGALMMTVGVGIEAAGLLHATGLAPDMGFWSVAWDRVWIVVGLPLILAPLTIGAYAGLSSKSTGQASAFLNLFRNIGGAAGISAAQTLLARRTPEHAARLAERASAFDARWRAASAGAHLRLGALYRNDALAGARSVRLLVAAIERQALVLSYIDVFWAFGVFMALALPLAILAAPRRSARPGDAGAPSPMLVHA